MTESNGVQEAPTNVNVPVAVRGPGGRFLKGTPSIGGRPKGFDRRLRELYSDDVPRLVGMLVKLGLGETPPGFEDIKASDRIKAAGDALDRIMGKAQQHIAVSEEPAQSPINVSNLTIAQLEALAMVELEEPEASEPTGDIH